MKKLVIYDIPNLDCPLRNACYSNHGHSIICMEKMYKEQSIEKGIDKVYEFCPLYFDVMDKFNSIVEINNRSQS